jgi:molybdenum cofactor synthesis domain-containing protein
VNIRAAVLTVSTSRAAGKDGDEGGDALAEYASTLGAQIVGREVIPDDLELVAERLRHWADQERCQIVLTTGGTGFTPTDLTPEATRQVIEREAPGIPEAMRAASRPHTKHWMLSRAVAGIRGSTLIVNFPGSPRSITEAGEAIAEALPHALKLIQGQPDTH